MSQQPPPLPQQVIDTILSHLIPPSIPLPRQLVAQPLLHRLEFVPPDIHDTDAYLTPIPQSTTTDPSATLASRLGTLVNGYVADYISYAFDGETVYARLPLGRDGEPAVLLIFSYESGLRSRGWVYHATELPGPDVLSWSDSIPGLPSQGTAPPVHHPTDDQPDLTAPQGYWEGFTPSTSVVDLTEAPPNDQDYWASYGQAMDSPRPDVGPSRPKTPLPAPSHPDASAADIRDKFESKIMLVLRSLWSSWVKGAERQDEMEERALSWLRITREALKGEQGSETREVVLSAKLQVLKEMFETVNETEDGFWRKVEEVVRMPVGRENGERAW